MEEACRTHCGFSYPQMKFVPLTGSWQIVCIAARHLQASALNLTPYGSLTRRVPSDSLLLATQLLVFDPILSSTALALDAIPGRKGGSVGAAAAGPLWDATTRYARKPAHYTQKEAKKTSLAATKAARRSLCRGGAATQPSERHKCAQSVEFPVLPWGDRADAMERPGRSLHRLYSAVGCRLSAVGCRLSAIGCRLSAIGCRLTHE